MQTLCALAPECNNVLALASINQAAAAAAASTDGRTDGIVQAAGPPIPSTP